MDVGSSRSAGQLRWNPTSLILRLRATSPALSSALLMFVEHVGTADTTVCADIL